MEGAGSLRSYSQEASAPAQQSQSPWEQPQIRTRSNARDGTDRNLGGDSGQTTEPLAFVL